MKRRNPLANLHQEWATVEEIVIATELTRAKVRGRLGGKLVEKRNVRGCKRRIEYNVADIKKMCWDDFEDKPTVALEREYGSVPLQKRKCPYGKTYCPLAVQENGEIVFCNRGCTSGLQLMVDNVGKEETVK